jgi:NAD(P)-dependent dehydrogenase (short-subunit alcohol dehydrogenase family)
VSAAPYLQTLFGLKGRVAVLTGAGGYLVSEMTLALARAGAAVVAVDACEETVRAVVERLTGEGANAIACRADVTSAADLRNVAERTAREFGPVDILINGAGINAPTPFFDIPLDEWKRIIDVHVTGTMLGCQVFGRTMVDRQRGSIVNISSASAGPPLSKAFAYSVAKAGIKNLTQNLAREWATKGVRVNALRPGFFPTEWSKQHFLTADRVQAILTHTPMARFGEPKELVSAVVWLCSDSASFVTGAEIAVDGGFSAMTV